jgi:hypothetical protein
MKSDLLEIGVYKWKERGVSGYDEWFSISRRLFQSEIYLLLFHQTSICCVVFLRDNSLSLIKTPNNWIFYETLTKFSSRTHVKLIGSYTDFRILCSYAFYCHRSLLTLLDSVAILNLEYRFWKHQYQRKYPPTYYIDKAVRTIMQPTHPKPCQVGVVE